MRWHPPCHASFPCGSRRCGGKQDGQSASGRQKKKSVVFSRHGVFVFVCDLCVAWGAFTPSLWYPLPVVSFQVACCLISWDRFAWVLSERMASTEKNRARVAALARVRFLTGVIFKGNYPTLLIRGLGSGLCSLPVANRERFLVFFLVFLVFFFYFPTERKKIVIIRPQVLHPIAYSIGRRLTDDLSDDGRLTHLLRVWLGYVGLSCRIRAMSLAARRFSIHRVPLDPKPQTSRSTPTSTFTSTTYAVFRCWSWGVGVIVDRGLCCKLGSCDCRGGGGWQ